MHTPVMAKQVVDLLAVKPGGIYLDVTLGMGGHAQMILERLGGHGCLWGLDRDARALELAHEKLGAWLGSCQLAQVNFGDMAGFFKDKQPNSFDGVLFDLGLSSQQLGDASRGFSFSHDGPLDMRMDQTQTKTAAELVNNMSGGELADCIWRYGEEPSARGIARAIVAERQVQPFCSTSQLADLVSRVKKGRSGRIHPATKVFQALRIMVNDEMENLRSGLVAAIDLLRPTGRLAVISYHSLEDRIVKHQIREHIGHWENLMAGGRQYVRRQPPMQWVTRKPLTPDAEEVRVNPRARSARLRVAERGE